ncbi:MAG: hypothetical protein AB7F31_01570 [Parachlamydiales bacterium]
MDALSKLLGVQAPYLPLRDKDSSDLNKWEKQVHRDDAADILQHTFIEEILLDEGNRKGEKMYVATLRLCSKDGVERPTTFNLYGMKRMAEATQAVHGLRQLALQLPDDELDCWMADGTRFRRAHLPEGSEGVAFDRYDPYYKKWQVVASRDNFTGIDPTIRNWEKDGSNQYWNISPKELVHGRYNRGIEELPWEWWTYWEESAGYFHPAPEEWHWAAKGFTDTSQRLGVMAAWRLGDLIKYATIDGWEYTGTWTENRALRVAAMVPVGTFRLLTAPIGGVISVGSGTLTFLWWGVSRSTIPLINGLNVWTRGSITPEMAKNYLLPTLNGMGESLGVPPINLYTGDDEIAKQGALFEEISKNDLDGSLAEAAKGYILYGRIENPDISRIILENQ